MNELYQILISAIIALFCTSWIRPYLLKVAKKKNIVDNPDARKLQRIPVPVLGGVNVVFGIVSGLMAYSFLGGEFNLFSVLATIIVILIIGLIDDTIAMSPKARFVVEVILVLYLIHNNLCTV